MIMAISVGFQPAHAVQPGPIPQVLGEVIQPEITIGEALTKAQTVFALSKNEVAELKAEFKPYLKEKIPALTLVNANNIKIQFGKQEVYIEYFGMNEKYFTVNGKAIPLSEAKETKTLLLAVKKILKSELKTTSSVSWIRLLFEPAIAQASFWAFTGAILFSVGILSYLIFRRMKKERKKLQAEVTRLRETAEGVGDQVTEIGDRLVDTVTGALCANGLQPQICSMDVICCGGVVSPRSSCQGCNCQNGSVPTSAAECAQIADVIADLPTAEDLPASPAEPSGATR